METRRKAARQLGFETWKPDLISFQMVNKEKDNIGNGTLCHGQTSGTQLETCSRLLKHLQENSFFAPPVRCYKHTNNATLGNCFALQKMYLFYLKYQKVETIGSLCLVCLHVCSSWHMKDVLFMLMFFSDVPCIVARCCRMSALSAVWPGNK